MTKHYWDRKARDWVPFPTRRYRPRLMIISDHHEPFKSMADGKMYDSKSVYRRTLKERGLEEVGNEYVEPKPFEPEGVEQDVKDAMDQIEVGKGADTLNRSWPEQWSK